MLEVFLRSRPSVTDRLLLEEPPQGVIVARAKVQAMLNEWQRNFGPGPVIDEWQRLLNMARNYTMVMDLLGELEKDTGR